MTCSTCRFWDRYGTDYGDSAQLKGDCRRQPPAISNALLGARLKDGGFDDIDDPFVLSVYLSSAFPVTHEASWCGEYADRNEVPLC